MTTLIGAPTVLTDPTARPTIRATLRYTWDYPGGTAGLGAGEHGITYAWPQGGDLLGGTWLVEGTSLPFQVAAAPFQATGVAPQGVVLVRGTITYSGGRAFPFELRRLPAETSAGVMDLRREIDPPAWTTPQQLAELIARTEAAATRASQAAEQAGAVPLDIANLIGEVEQSLADSAQSAAEALAVTGINPAYISETSNDPPAAPDGTRGAKRSALGELTRLLRQGGLWLAVGAPLLARGSTREVLTSWYVSVQSALDSGAKTVWLDDDRICTTTLNVPAGVTLARRGGSLTFTGAPDATTACVNLAGVGAQAVALPLRVTAGDYRRGVAHRAAYTRQERCTFEWATNDLAAGASVSPVFASMGASTPMPGVEIVEPRIISGTSPRAILISVAYCPGVQIIRPRVDGWTTTSPNKLDWALYLAQECDNAVVNLPLVQACPTIGGIHTYTGGPKSTGIQILSPTIRNVGFIGIALETFRDIRCTGAVIEGAGLPLSVGTAGIGDQGATVTATIGNVGTPLGSDAEMCAVNAENSSVALKLGARGNGVRGVLVNGKNVVVTLESVLSPRPIILAQWNTTATGGSLQVPEVPDLDVADQGTTQPAVYLLAPDTKILPGGNIVHTTSNTAVNVVHIGAVAHRAQVKGVGLDGTGRPVRVLAGATDVRVELPRYGSRFANATVNNAGTNTFIHAPQTQADLSPPVVVGITRTSANKTAAYQMLAGDDVIRALTNSAALTITLPDVTTVALGRTYTVKAAGTNAATLSGAVAGQNIDGAFTVNIASMAALTVMARAGGWDVIGRG